MTRRLAAMAASSRETGFSAPPLATLLSLVAANLVFIYVVVVFEHHHVHEENSLLESVQAGVLAFGMLLYLAATRAGTCALVCPALALLSFSFFLREVDVEHLPLPEPLRIIGSGKGKIVMLLALWAPLAWRLWHRLALDPALPGTLARSAMTRLFGAVVVLLLVSFVMDKEFFVLEHARLYEELAETNAYLLLVCGGLASLVGLYWKGTGAARAPEGAAPG